MSQTTLEQLRQLLQRRTSTASRQPSSRILSPADWLPDSGLSPGDVSEWIMSDAGGGTLQVAINAICQRLLPESRWLIVDAEGEWFPTAWEEAGLSLSRTVFVRDVATSDALWAVEQSLRSRGVDVVCCRFGKLTSLLGRRLKIAAEAGNSLCLMLRGPEALREASWADLRVRVSPLPSPDWLRRRLQLEVLKIRNGFPGRVAQVELDDETGAVRVVSELADSAAAQRAAGA